MQRLLGAQALDGDDLAVVAGRRRGSGTHSCARRRPAPCRRRTGRGRSPSWCRSGRDARATRRAAWCADRAFRSWCAPFTVRPTSTVIGAAPAGGRLGEGAGAVPGQRRGRLRAEQAAPGDWAVAHGETTTRPKALLRPREPTGAEALRLYAGFRDHDARGRDDRARCFAAAGRRGHGGAGRRVPCRCVTASAWSAPSPTGISSSAASRPACRRSTGWSATA